ncbi:hypothetical protein [Carboxylicivirga marina]|uniref:hypothetical protein n=1 Tax=Carboxylicivirga marina TaxID=2800988 RepID=UPI002596E04C|nr:hypothetical protein [uncultured Carboxylicivirga sp.]
MTFTDQQLQEIRGCGERNLPARSIAMRLQLNKQEELALFVQFDDHNSLVRKAWENGRLDKMYEIEDHLRDTVKGGLEGSGDAARAINYLQRKRLSDDLKHELFGV